MKDFFSESDNTTVISTEGLTKVYGNLVAVNDLHLQVMRSDVFGFLGLNGSGKTTTIRMLLGLIRPTAGRAFLFGMDNTRQLPTILRRLGAIVEMPVFYPYLSGRDNLRVLAAVSMMPPGKTNSQRIKEVIEIVGLCSVEKLAYRKYSLGMKQRLGIAAALLTDPELILLDEPTNGLDPAGVIEIRRLIKQLSALGKTIFVSSHILHEIQHVCNRVAILQKGNLVKQGNVNELLSHSEQIEVHVSGEKEVYHALAILQHMRGQEASWIADARIETNKQDQQMLRINAPINRSGEINAILAHNNIFATEIHPREGNLEEVFLQLTTSSSPTSLYTNQQVWAKIPSPLASSVEMAVREKQNIR
jgi:ABC-2 type transport system ATP-binding protein